MGFGMEFPKKIPIGGPGLPLVAAVAAAKILYDVIEMVRNNQGGGSADGKENRRSDEEDDEENDFDDAYSYDNYKVDTTQFLSESEKKAILQTKKNQTPKGHLPKNMRNQNVPIASESQLSDSKNKFERLDPNERSDEGDENLWRRPTWLYVRTPSAFNYTGAVVTNMLDQGLLHMVIRHGHEFAGNIRDLDTIFNRLPENIRNIITKIQNADDQPTSYAMITRLEKELKKLDRQTFEDIEEILYELQMKLYKYIQRNMDSYLGEGCNNRGRQTVFFKVRDRQGLTKVMVLCVSDQLYHNPHRFGNDRRPVRTIITCYFLSWNEYMSRRVDNLF